MATTVKGIEIESFLKNYPRISYDQALNMLENAKKKLKIEASEMPGGDDLGSCEMSAEELFKSPLVIIILRINHFT